MKKIVIFNVGGALSAYAEFDDKKVIIDIGSSSTFSPVEDFLVPLTKKKIFEKDNQGKFLVNQLFFSHLDRDHISDYPKFKEKFNAHYMTCPNDNENKMMNSKLIENYWGKKMIQEMLYWKK